MENIARYIIRASFFKESMKYFPEKEKEFSTLEWMAVLCSHIPYREKQTVRLSKNI